MVGAEGTDKKLFTKHAEVFVDRKYSALSVKLGDVWLEDGNGDYSQCFIL